MKILRDGDTEQLEAWISGAEEEEEEEEEEESEVAMHEGFKRNGCCWETD